MTGNVTFASVKATDPLTMMLGSPVKVVPETAQLEGSTVICAAMEPVSELFRLPEIPPSTEMVPPPEHAPLYDTGKLQLSPLAVGLQPEEDDVSA